MFKKKFKIRVKRYYEAKYVVEFAYYRFFRIWSEIIYWKDPVDIWNTNGWHPIIFKNYQDAENYAKKLDSWETLISSLISSLFISWVFTVVFSSSNSSFK